MRGLLRWIATLLLGDGTARCWGSNLFGELGDGTMVERSTPVLLTVLP